MAPKRQRCEHYRYRTFKLLCDSSTQTDVLTDFLIPKVVLRRLQIVSENTKISNKEPSDTTEPISVQHPSLPNLQAKRPSNISRAPNNYRTFVKPITNNQKANSTLVNLTRNEDEQSITGNKCTNYNKPVRFLRPGPLCYKQRVLQEFDEDMNIPIMRCEPANSIQEPRQSVHLETILEQENETSPPDIPDVNMAISNLESYQEEANFETQTGSSLTNFVDLEHISQKHTDIENQNNGDKQEPTHIKMRLNGITTIISHSSTQNLNDSSSNDENQNKENEYHTSAKVVKIKAHTVHIHNHFYKSS